MFGGWPFPNFGGFGGNEGEGGHPQGGAGVLYFEAEYQVFPTAFLNREDIDKGNKIILPSSALEQLARLNVSYPMLFRLTNAASGIHTHGGVLEFTAEEGTAYLPYWMMRNLVLAEGDILSVRNVTLGKGTFVKLQPVTSDFLEISNPKAVLENTLRHFACLTVGDLVPILFAGKIFEIEISDLKPKRAVSIIEADIEVDFLPPKDYVEPPQKFPGPAAVSPEAAEASVAPPPGALFGGSAQRLDGKKPKAADLQQPPVPAPEIPEEPWLLRVKGGVKRDPPYGYQSKFRH